jgi:HSP20 family protein
MPTDDLQREMERYLAHFSRHAKRPTILFTHLHPQVSAAWTPAVDMFETDEAVVALFDLAGLDADKTEVHAEPNLLVVRGVRRERHPPNGERNYHTLEIPYGRFERKLYLPPGTDASAAEASYRDGMLEVRVPKRVARQVPILTQEQR